MGTIFKERPYLKIKYYPEKGYILFRWQRFNITLSQLKIAHKKALKIAEEAKCFYYIVDSSEVELTLSPEVLGWWRSEWVPKLLDAGIKAILTVMPGNFLSKYSTEAWHTADYKNIILKNFKNIEEAERFLKKIISGNK